MPVADLGNVSIHYREYGAGPPVLGIMGFALDQRFWATQVPTISARHRFITFDNRGVGRSSRSAVSTIDEMADDAFRLLDHLGIDETIVFGVSMGGAIAQRLTLDHPERVRALILAVTFARPIEFMRRQAALARALLRAGGPDLLFEASLVRLFTPRFFEVGQDAIDRMVESFLDVGDAMATEEVLLGQLDALDKHDTLGELPRISCPSLVIGGKLDMMVPCFASEEIAAAIPGAELSLFETGHGLMVEEMETCNARIEEFLAGLD